MLSIYVKIKYFLIIYTKKVLYQIAPFSGFILLVYFYLQIKDSSHYCYIDKIGFILKISRFCSIYSKNFKKYSTKELKYNH